MNDRVPPFRAHTRNPIVQSLALAVLGIALLGAIVIGAFVVAALLGLMAVGYLAALAHAWWRWTRLRRRAAYLTEEPAASARVFDGNYAVVEAAVDSTRPGPGS